MNASRGVLQPFGDVLAPVDVSVRHPLQEPGGGFVIAVRVVEDEEALHSRAEHDQQSRMERRLWPLGVVQRDLPADHYPCPDVQAPLHGL